MANLNETPQWDSVPRVERTTKWIGANDATGDIGTANQAAQALANRTALLKQRLDTQAAEADPFPQYETASEVALKFASHTDAADPHPQYATEVGVYAALAGKITFLRKGVALPVSDIGPIWHEDYNSLMTWQVFGLNGSAYKGYASVLVGSLLMDTQPNPRAGYLRSGVSNLSRAAYAALRGWAIHNGVMVSSGVWAAGTVAVSDNNDGETFRVFDVRGEFPRFWDESRGADFGRAFGSWQKPTLVSGTDDNNNGDSLIWAGLPCNVDGMEQAWKGGANSYITSMASSIYAGNSYMGGAVRPRNIALLACIKF